MSDHKAKFIELLEYCGIDFELDGNDILIDSFHTDGMEECWITFYDDGEFKDFCYYPSR